MRKLALAALILIGCASFEKKVQPDFSFRNVEQLKVGKSTLSDIAHYFGEPAEATRNDGKETWSYKDRYTDYQRLTVTFDSASILQSVIWIPLPSEEEVHLEKITDYFPQANFRKFPGPNNNPHSISSLVSYVDEKLGMTLVYQKGRNVVEAVVWTNNSRGPATLEESKSIPYKIDNL